MTKTTVFGKFSTVRSLISNNVRLITSFVGSNSDEQFESLFKNPEDQLKLQKAINEVSKGSSKEERIIIGGEEIVVST